jgi:hypothetical protein
MPLTVLRDGAAPVILTNRTVFNRLPDDVDVIALLSAIGAGQAVPVTFRDGSRVHLTSLDPPLQLEAPAQQALMLSTPDLVPRAFELECQILVPVEASVMCVASNKRAAADLVSGVFSGARSPNPGFSVEVDRDRVAKTFAELERALLLGQPAQLAALGLQHDVLINRIEER